MNACRSERGFTLVEIMIVVAIIALLAAIAIPNVLRGRTSANETAAIGNFRALLSSGEMFRSVMAGYPSVWQAQMYGACTTPGNPTPGVAPDPDYGPPMFCRTMAGGAANVVQGYTYTYTPANLFLSGVTLLGSTYTITAVPQNNQTGTRSFFVDSTGVTRHCTCPPAGVCPVAAVTDPSIDQAPINC